MDYKTALMEAWLTDIELAEFFGVTLQSVQRWKRINKTPTGVIAALKLLAGNCPNLSAIDGWQDWRFKGGFLWSPNGECFTPGDIRASKMDYDIIRGYERETARLHTEINALKNKLTANHIESVKTATIIPFPKAPKLREPDSIKKK